MPDIDEVQKRFKSIRIFRNYVTPAEPENNEVEGLLLMVNFINATLRLLIFSSYTGCLKKNAMKIQQAAGLS
jgi:cellulose biosynthesis protein BcsQ